MCDKRNKKFKVIRAGFWFTVSNILLKGISMITIPLFTRMLSSEEYGLLSVYVSIQQIVLIMATWDIAYGAYQKGLFKYKENEAGFTKSTLLFCNIITIMLFAIISIFYDFLYKWILIPKKLLIVLFVYCLMQPAYRHWMVRKQKVYAYKPVIMVTMFLSVGMVTCSIIALFFFRRTANVKFGTEMIISIAVFIVFYITSFGDKEGRLCFEETIQQMIFMVKFQAPCVMHSISLIILAQADRVMISIMAGKSQAAFYSVAYTLTGVITMFTSAIDLVLTPWRFQKMEEKKYGEIGKNANILLGGISVIVLGLILAAPEIMKIFFTENYYEAVYSIPPIALSSIFVFLYSSFAGIESYLEKTGYIMVVSVACSILNIILNYILIRPFGYIICGYTTVISYICFALGHYYFMKKVCHSEIIGARIFNVKIILMICFFASIFATGIILLYPYPVVRYCILGLAVLIILKFKNQIIKFWMNIKRKGRN